MKRIFSFLLALSLLLLCAPAALAANKDLTFTKDETISSSFVAYNNITVKSGAHVVIDKNAGFEITGTITVESGASLTGNGKATGEFNFFMRSKDADIIGIPLYYRLEKDDGSIEVRKIPGGYKTVAALDDWDWSGWCPRFEWNTEVQGWCLTGVSRGNPFNEYFYHNERDMNSAEAAAGVLNRLGLLRGIKTMDGAIHYELERSATRLEALIMLIRLLGKEEEALNGEWSHPFTDVPYWQNDAANQYVGYAYETGLTNGIGGGKFGSDDTADSQMYLTFLLRALGYTDADTGSTVWAEAISIAEKLDIIPKEDEGYRICLDDFWRADMVLTSYRTLEQTTKSGQRLCEKLIDDGVFTDEQYRNQ